MAKNYGKNVLGVFFDNVAVDATEYSTTVNIGNPKTNAGVCISVYADDALTVATGSAYSIEVLLSTTTNPTVGTDHVHVIPFSLTAADDEVVVAAAGGLITQYVIPPELFAAGYVYARLHVAADVNTEKVTAIAHVLI